MNQYFARKFIYLFYLFISIQQTRRSNKRIDNNMWYKQAI